MVHLEDEEIARLIDGSVSKKERELYLNHLSRCDSCLTVYNESLAFIQQEESAEEVSLKPSTVTIVVNNYWEKIKNLFKQSGYQLAAVVLLLLIFIPAASKFIFPGSNQLIINSLEIDYLEKNIEYRGSPDPKYRKYSYIRTGIIYEDLLFLLDTSGNQTLKTEILKRLTSELRLISTGTVPSYQFLAHMEKQKLIEYLSKLPTQFKELSFATLFAFGRFLEQDYMDTFRGNKTQTENFERFFSIIQEPGFDLSQDILEGLTLLKKSEDKKARLNAHVELKVILYSIDSSSH